MRLRQAKTTLTLAAAVLALSASYAAAQEKNNPTGDIKPAQTGSPGAHPVSTPDNNERQVGERSDNNDRNTNRPNATRTDNTQRTANGSNRTEGNLERQLAACLLTKNKGEVELGKYAADHSKNSDVKEFAEQMVKDHGQIVEKLEQIVGSQEPNDQRSKIDREIDEQCMASLKKELTSKKGEDFDACYVGSQIAGHMQMAATLKVISAHASGQLTEVVNDARPTVDKHLAHAQKLMEELDRSRDHTQAAKERSDKTR